MNDHNIFAGIDFHKRYSVISAQDAGGKCLLEARVNGNTPEGFKSAFSQLPGKSKVAMEACWNWGKLYDILEGLPGIEEIVLSDGGRDGVRLQFLYSFLLIFYFGLGQLGSDQKTRQGGRRKAGRGQTSIPLFFWFLNSGSGPWGQPLK